MKEEQMGVYVGTYKKYANGNLSGKWLRLLDYKDYDEDGNPTYLEEWHDFRDDIILVKRKEEK